MSTEILHEKYLPGDLGYVIVSGNEMKVTQLESTPGAVKFTISPHKKQEPVTENITCEIIEPLQLPENKKPST